MSDEEIGLLDAMKEGYLIRLKDVEAERDEALAVLRGLVVAIGAFREGQSATSEDGDRCQQCYETARALLAKEERRAT